LPPPRPGLIWGLAHILLGAVLLHGGLIAMAVLIWRDPTTRARLSEIVARRRTHPRDAALNSYRDNHNG